MVDTRRAVRTVPLDDFRPHPENPKAHDVEAIITSIVRFGFADPVVVDQRTGLTVSGHGRIEALQAMRDRGDGAPDGVEGWKVPTYVGWASADDVEARGMIVALNRLTETGGWDDVALAGLLEQLATVDNGLDGIGYTGDDLAELRAKLAAIEDQAEPAPITNTTAAARTRHGDLWAVGSHRILCGDATGPDSYTRLLDGGGADMVLTDPPYGVDIQERDATQAQVRGRRTDGKGVLNDDLTGDALATFLVDAFTACAGSTRPGAVWYVFGPSGVDYRHPLNALADLGIARHGLVWVKDRFVMGRADYHYRHENIIYGWTPGAAHHKLDARDVDSVIEHPRPAASVDHPTIKPLELVEGLIAASSSHGATVLDPFAGSGTTTVAAHRTGRVGYSIELDPSYVDVIVRRLQAETGEPAVHADTGEQFDDRQPSRVEAAG